MLEEERDSLSKPYIFGPEWLNLVNEFIQQYRYRAEFWHTSPFGEVEKVVLGYSDDKNALKWNVMRYGDYEYFEYPEFVKNRVYETKSKNMSFTIVDTFSDLIYKDMIRKTKTESPEKLTEDDIRNTYIEINIKRRI